MHAFFRNLMLAALVVVLAAGAASAQEKQKKKGKGQQRNAFGQMMKKARDAGLSNEEISAIKEVTTKYAEQMKDAVAAVDKAIGGPEGRKKLNAARKAAADEGKKGKEMQDAILAALGLDDDGVKAYEEAQAAMQKLNQEVRAELSKSLSPESLQKIGMGARGGKGKGKKKGGG